MRNLINCLDRIHQTFPWIHIIGAMSAVLFFVAIVLWPQAESIAKSSDSIVHVPLFQTVTLDNTPLPLDTPAQMIIMQDPVRTGDSLSKLFGKQGLPIKVLHDIIKAETSNLQISRVKVGQKIEFRLTDQILQEVALIHSPFRQTVAFKVTESTWMIEHRTREPDIYIENAVGSIHSSLFRAGAKAGLPDHLIMDFANIFGHVIDFVHEIKRNDKFVITFEKRYLDGEFIEYGNILAAEFVNNNESFKAIRFTNTHGETGYFDEKGVSLRKAFLRAPLNFRRISSNFSHSRKHPITGVKRPHKGTDYAAPTGTPVYAAGDGTFIFRGTKGGYGKTIILKHGNDVTTLYGHLSQYSKHRIGEKVTQGETIGYVGSTGLSTGPHLHYEFIFNGVHRNPRTILDKLPKAKSLRKNEIKSFQGIAAVLLASLEAQHNAELAYQKAQK